MNVTFLKLKFQQFGGNPNSLYHLLREAEHGIDLFDLFEPKQGQTSNTKECVERVHLHAKGGARASCTPAIYGVGGAATAVVLWAAGPA